MTVVATFFIQPKNTSLGWRADVNGKIFTAMTVSVLRQSIATHLRSFLQKGTTISLDVRCRENEKKSWKFDVYRLTPNF